jgi:23S rRNA (guanine2445-N2)-methyltransferase / 23S rRNA (guanine2069-N7)-methyltransferase
VEFSGHGSGIDNTHFGALKVKDAIVDKLRTEACARRSTRSTRTCACTCAWTVAKAILSLDLSGHSLHQRGYRLQQGAAPLKENLAAAVLIRAGWPRIAAEGGAHWPTRCAVWYLPGRGGDDRRRHGAQPQARALGLHRLARPCAGVVAQAA